MPNDEERQLLIVSEINFRFEKLIRVIGARSLTVERLTEVVADVVMPDRTEYVRICPGWGKNMNHLWMYTHDSHPKVGNGIIERCSSHPERRVNYE